ncbi:HNH endonuclease [Brevundimonas diminuta]|uniref:HNH nuclease domain-containing protein n=1 Tax=Brevundimonas diminuta TaxID=293 RepID=A0A2X1CCB9_BREDI|nr:HNH endonuclease [Brevundimonas diminuta]SPU44286.1 Uncharacterised protein [Brevundimonas diminuta]
MTADLSALIARLEELTEPDLNGGCLLWSGPSFSGRGRERPYLAVDGQRWLAHRAIYYAATGVNPGEGFVCHKCDVPMCVNPRHLYLGNHKSNMADMTERRRYFAATQPDRCREAGLKAGRSNTWTRGAKNPKAKLTGEQAAAIRADNRSTKAVASDYGVDRTTIQRIRRGSLWLRAKLDGCEVNKNPKAQEG